MRRICATWLLVGLVACGQSAARIEPSARVAPRLLPPPQLVDVDTPQAVYRTVLALQLQPGWAQFLDDCRLRLPAGHALNVMSLVASAELAIDAGGRIADLHLTSSGNADFDRAARQVIDDAMPLPRPPPGLWSDDDLVHVRWQFARDRRQAGPSTAAVLTHDLPVRGVVHRLVTAGELARAAQRIRRAPHDGERDAATFELMVAALREGVTSTDATVRRAAVEAVGRAGVRELAAAVRDLMGTTSDIELRLAALDAVARLGDRASVPILVDQLRGDLRDDRRLASAETQTLVALGAAAAAATIIGDELARGAAPDPIALHALGAVAVAGALDELAPRLTTWQRTGDARTRTAVCAAFAYAPSAVATPGIVRGIRDRDATVRASCLDALRARAPITNDIRPLHGPLRKLATDRDALVRARALAALSVFDPAGLPDASDDRAPEVRAAYATAIAVTRPADAEPRLVALLDDRDADVRQAAWTAWLALPAGAATHAARGRHAVRAATDAAPQVRRASLVALDDDALLTRLATTDDDAQVRTAASIALAARRGRIASSDLLLERLAAAPPGSAERVRTALAWLLAR